MSNNYSSSEFWDRRYKEKDIVFDWYVEYPELKHALQNLYTFPKDASILMVGCGNSNFSEQLFDHGFTNITNIDVSSVVIQQMSQRMAEKGKHMKWEVMDATNTSYKDEEFDVVIDKGTLDALICGTDLSLSDAMLKEMGRIVKRDGQILIITHSRPEGRKRVFQSELSFDSYDYFFSKIYLSSSNILVNLMKANKMAHKQLTEKQIMTRTMLQYSLVQMKKKKTVPERFQILWSQFGTKKANAQKQDTNFSADNQNKVQFGNKDSNVLETTQTIEQKQKKSQTNQKPSENTYQQNKICEATEAVQKAEIIQEQSKVVFKKAGDLNPKQPFCFIYCITRKPYFDLISKTSISHLNAPIDPLSITNLSTYGNTMILNQSIESYIAIQTQNTNTVLTAIKYMQVAGIYLPKILINPSQQLRQSLKKDNKLLNLKYRINETPDRSSMLISMRSEMNFQLQVVNSNPIGIGMSELQIIQQIVKRAITITQNNPKYNISSQQYQKLNELSINSKQSINDLIKSTQKPQIIIVSYSLLPDSIVIKGKLCLSPTAEVQDYESLTSIFEGFTITNFNKGYFYTDPDNTLLQAVSPICRSHGEITLERLWLSYYENQFSSNFDETDGFLVLSERVAVYVLVNILTKLAQEQQK